MRVNDPDIVISNMSQNIALVTLVVDDYDKAISFYVSVLGFELVEDTYVAKQDKRWVVVRPKGEGSTGLLLAKAANEAQRAAIGNQTGGRVGFFLYSDDFERDYQLYKSRGVEFLETPRTESYGTVVVFTDPSGNTWDLLEPRRKGQISPGQDQD